MVKKTTAKKPALGVAENGHHPGVKYEAADDTRTYLLRLKNIRFKLFSVTLHLQHLHPLSCPLISNPVINLNEKTVEFCADCYILYTLNQRSWS